MTPLWIQELSSLTGRLAVVTDSHVFPLVEKELQREGTTIHTFSAGESSKTRATKERIEDEMLAAGHGRESTLIALGGGVVTDLGGYIAATFRRGIPLVMVPTSLLAMVDASIGGKNGVNTSCGKNLIGTFYPPQEIILDLSFLKTLPEREFRNGMMEVIKYGLIHDADLLKSLEQAIPSIQNPDALLPIIDRCIAIKKEIVTSDPLETGFRRILNFGHTIGHALELLSDFQLSHGEAIGLGMIAESKIAADLGYCQCRDRIYHIVTTCCPHLTWPTQITQDQLWTALLQDKKSSNGQPRMVAIQTPGHPHSFNGTYCTPLPPKIHVNLELNS